jgi:hypothetical protein
LQMKPKGRSPKKHAGYESNKNENTNLLFLAAMNQLARDHQDYFMNVSV